MNLNYFYFYCLGLWLSLVLLGVIRLPILSHLLMIEFLSLFHSHLDWFRLGLDLCFEVLYY